MLFNAGRFYLGRQTTPCIYHWNTSQRSAMAQDLAKSKEARKTALIISLQLTLHQVPNMEGQTSQGRDDELGFRESESIQYHFDRVG